MNRTKITQFIFVLLMTFLNSKAMVTHHRIECGDLYINIYDDTIIAYDSRKNPIGMLRYSANINKFLEIKGIETDFRYQSFNLELRLVKAAELRAEVLESEILGVAFEEQQESFWNRLGFIKRDLPVPIFYKPIIKSRL